MGLLKQLLTFSIFPTMADRLTRQPSRRTCKRDLPLLQTNIGTYKFIEIKKAATSVTAFINLF